jgi:excinuclease UvrABC nuclease subunit
MTVHDLTQEQDELASFRYTFNLWPRQWLVCAYHVPFQWQTYKFVDSERENIPIESGIYTFVVMPYLFGHPSCAFLMYVGRTNSLRRRFSDYLREKGNEQARPKIVRLLNKYPDNIWFCYTVIAKADISHVEDTLIEAYMPPCNDQFPASVRRILKAF